MTGCIVCNMSDINHQIKKNGQCFKFFTCQLQRLKLQSNNFKDIKILFNFFYGSRATKSVLITSAHLSFSLSLFCYIFFLTQIVIGPVIAILTGDNYFAVQPHVVYSW